MRLLLFSYQGKSLALTCISLRALPITHACFYSVGFGLSGKMGARRVCFYVCLISLLLWATLHISITTPFFLSYRLIEF